MLIDDDFDNMQIGGETAAKPVDSARASEEKAEMPPPPKPTFQRQVKKKKDFGAALGIKKKAGLV